MLLYFYGKERGIFMKIWTLCGLIVFLVLLSSCATRYDPLEGIDIEDYYVLYETDDFTIWELQQFPELEYKMCLSYADKDLEGGESPCIRYPGSDAWILEFDGKYYDLGVGYKLDLYNTADLIEYGVGFN